MGLFDFLHRKKTSPDPSLIVEDSERLRDELFNTVRKDDVNRFNALYFANKDRVARFSPEWNKNRALANADRATLNEYINVLAKLAQALSRLGHPQLMDKLMGKDTDRHEFDGWQKQINRSVAL